MAISRPAQFRDASADSGPSSTFVFAMLQALDQIIVKQFGQVFRL
jgi:hypothetical protein